MNKPQRKHIVAVIAEVLNLVDISLSDEQLRSQLPNWDSLKHLELILRVEEQFHVRFTSREVAEIEGIHHLIEMIEAKL